MKGLIVKEFINLSKSFILVGLMIIFYGIFSFMTDSPGSFSGMFTIMFAMFLFSTYSLDEMANWDIYALTMPLTRDNIIQSKYLLMLMLSFLGFIISAGSLLLLNLATKAEDLFAGFELPTGGFAIVIIFYSILLPIVSKLGIIKARIYFVAIYMLPFIIGVFIYKKVKESIPILPEKLITFIELIKDNIFIIVPLVLIIALGISYYLSIRIYRKKEF